MELILTYREALEIAIAALEYRLCNTNIQDTQEEKDQWFAAAEKLRKKLRTI